jgi:membrane-associated protease RseP (regulator of RpoE activity)
MRHSILLSVLLIPALNIGAYCAQCTVVERSGGPYSFTVASDVGFIGDEESTGAYLGVDITDVSSDRLSALKLKDERGVEVTMVDQDAPAGKAGLKEHDVILTMNGSTVESGAQLRRMIRETPPGRTVTFGVSRDGQPVTVKVQLADRRKTVVWGPKAKDFKFEMPEMPNMSDFDIPVSVVVVHSGMRSGLMIENITPQLGDFFGVKNGKGVLIRSVEKGSRAEKSGFRAGDVIVRVNDQTVHDTSDFSHALRSTAKGTVAVGIVRDKKEQTLTLPLPDRKDSGEYLEESFDPVDMDAEVRHELSRARENLAQLQPQMQYAIQESRRALDEVKPEIERAQRAAREAVERERPQIERALREAQAANERVQRELCTQQRALGEQSEKMQRQFHRQQERFMKDNRKQMERIRHEMKGDWMPI